MAFVLFEGPYAPVEWATIGTHSSRCKATYISLVEKYQPEAVVLEDTANRIERVQKRNQEIQGQAIADGTFVMQFSRQDIQDVFAYLDVVNKDTIAREITKHIPWFEQHLPPERKPWMSEHPRMGLFDATALALMFYQSELSCHDQPRLIGSG